MYAAGDDFQRHIHPSGQQHPGHRDQRLGVTGMVRQLQGAVVDVHAGIGVHARTRHHVHHLVLRHPKTRGNTGSLLEYMVIGTHAVQRPGANGTQSGGDNKYIESMALAAKAFGANGYFFEVHPTPEKALCDGANSLHISKLQPLIKRLL